MHLTAGKWHLRTFLVFTIFALLIGQSAASLGDRLPEFKECVKVNRIASMGH